MARSAEDYYCEANDRFVDEQYDEAGTAYDKAIELDPTKAVYYLHRANNHVKLEDHLDAIADCEKALELDEDLHKAYERKGEAYFEMDEFESALESFENAKKLGNTSCSLWIRKCRVELKQEEKTTPQPNSSKKKTVVSDDDDDDDDSVSLTDDSDSDSDSDDSKKKKSWHPAPTKLKPKPKEKVRVDWCQSLKYVSITLFVKGMDEDNIEAACEGQRLHCVLTLPDGDTWEREWNLFGPIKANRFSYSCGTATVELKVKKLKKGQWTALEDKKHSKKTKKRQNLHGDYVPRKGAKSAQDWDDLEKEAIKDANDLKPLGGDAMNALFQQIYRDATPETRRAMNKSYQTSGGTVLSTNWKEVKEKDYESDIQPLPGCIVKNYKDEV